MLRLLIVFSLIFYSFFGFQPVEPHVYFLAPQSEVGKLSNQKQFEAILVENNQLRKRVLSADKKLQAKDLIKHIQQLGKIKPNNREQYIVIRGLLSWWFFYEKDINIFVSGEYKKESLKALSSFEKSFDLIFPDTLIKMNLPSLPLWDKASFYFEDPDDNFFKVIFGEVYEQRDSFNQWLMQKGVLAKALHVVHSIPMEELKSAFESEKIQVRVFPKGYGEHKHVLKLEVEINDKSYYLAFKQVYQEEAEGTEKEIAAINMNHDHGLPLIGASFVEEGMWLDEYIMGYDLDKFILKLAQLGYSPEQIVKIWQQVQKEAAKKFILLFVRGFSGLYYMGDPHTGNVMAYWPILQENQLDPDKLDINQIKLTLLDIGGLDASFVSFETLPVNTAVVDVGGTKQVETPMIAEFFQTTYDRLFVDSQDDVLSSLPEIPFLPPPSRLEFVKEVLTELSPEEKVIFISALLQGLPQEIEMLKFKRAESVLMGSTEKLAKANKTKKELENLSQYLKTFVSKQANELIAESKSLKGKLPPEFIEKWKFVSALTQEKNGFSNFDQVNEGLKALASSASSSVRSLAAKIYTERTGNDLGIGIEFSSPITAHDISL